MQYRRFGKLDWKVSALGFGCMRLPTLDGKIHRQEAIRMLHHAIDLGVNYIDTAWPYHNEESEPLVGEALAGGHRHKVRIATKLPSWLIHTQEDFDKYFYEQLKRLKTDHVDFYLLHTLNKEYWPRLKNLEVFRWAEKKIAEGKIRHLGFSFHDEYPLFEEIVDSYDWAFCQIQYNYMDIDSQAGSKGLMHAHAKGLAVVVMEPLLGGRLVNPPEPVEALWKTATRKRAAADWALQWLWNQPQVGMVLSGMSSMEQVDQNIASADNSKIGLLSPQELALYDQVRDQYKNLNPIPCTNCRYCLPCPQGVDIPRNFTIYNEGKIYNKLKSAQGEYAWLKQSYEKGRSPQDERAASCTSCGECEEKCPQNIPISTLMPKVHLVLTGDKTYSEIHV